MNISRRLTSIVLFALASSLLISLPAAEGSPCPSPPVEQRFPADETQPEQTRWRVSVCDLGRPFGLVIGVTDFRTSPDPTKDPRSFIKILHDARVSEILVPYHDNSDRFFDISTFSQGLMTLGDVECPTRTGPGLPIVSLIENNKVCREVRDRGLAWKHDTGARRGQELVLWGVLRAFNYVYIMEWIFRDDGVIVANVGATGRNFPGHPDVTHMHAITWRLDVDLNGASGNSAKLGTHNESGLTATDRELPINREGGHTWDALAFTTLHIYDAHLVNGQAKPSSYRLIPLRSGTSRHRASNEKYTQQDFWVTRFPGNKADQMFAKDLPSYVNGEDVSDADIVVWYTGSIHHIERDEDDGVTQVMKVGFLLMPHDLFSAAPLFP